MEGEERPERDQFWLVWRENGPSPTFRHFDKQSALNEATRLAKLNPGECFYVMKATAGVVAQEPDVKRVKFTTDPIPF